MAGHYTAFVCAANFVAAIFHHFGACKKKNLG